LGLQLACGSDALPLCTPGASAACACPGGGSGAKICNNQGTFEACSCAGPDAGLAADAGLATDTPASAPQTDGPAMMMAPPDGGPAIFPDLPVAPGGPRGPLDILFLIDNSPSMKEEQDNLRRNFPVLMDELKKFVGGLPDLHIGVVSSDLGAGSRPLANGGCARPGGDRGIFQTKPTCGLGSARFISSANNGTLNNFSGDINNVFSCIADLGVAGCGYEHQLQATRVALYESITRENAGFLREDARLLIVIISDEDDCSAETTSDLFTDDMSFPMTTGSFRCAQVGHLCEGKAPPIAPFAAPLESCQANPAGRLIKVNEMVDSIRALKKRPDQQIFVSGIFGWPGNATGAVYRYAPTAQGIVDVAPICQSAGGDAFAGLRLKTFVESFGANGSFFSICQNDFAPALKRVGEVLAGRF
jgi:hypothetical protein